jgi:hypothetical protein
MTPNQFLASLKKHNTEQYTIVTTLRDLILKNKKTTEEVKYGGLLYSTSKPYTGIFTYKDHVNLEFTDGAKLNDPTHLLTGNGKYRRHCTFKTTKDIQKTAITNFLKQAVKLHTMPRCIFVLHYPHTKHITRTQNPMEKECIIYQTKRGEIEFRGDLEKETLWASLQQIANLFETDKSGVSRHIKNIYSSGELQSKGTVAKIATVQKEGVRTVKRTIEYYNLDMIISVGYRINSKTATTFRQWATKTLREHITKGYTINKKRIAKNYNNFLQSVEAVRTLLPKNDQMKGEDALELIKMFAHTWLSLDAYDTSSLPKSGTSKKKIRVSAKELARAITGLKQELLKRKEATELFAQERQIDAITGIVGNVFQTAFGQDVYKTIEEKSAHLLYFFVKNHPFVDGNKRSGAFAFVWFLQKAKILRKEKISPEALTALTLLVAESDPSQKNQIIGLILQLLKT